MVRIDAPLRNLPPLSGTYQRTPDRVAAAVRWALRTIMRDRRTASSKSRPTQHQPLVIRHFASAEVDLDDLAEALRLLLASGSSRLSDTDEPSPAGQIQPCIPFDPEGHMSGERTTLQGGI